MCLCVRAHATPPPAPKGVRVCVWVRSCLVALIAGCGADRGWTGWRGCLKLGEGMSGVVYMCWQERNGVHCRGLKGVTDIDGGDNDSAQLYVQWGVGSCDGQG